jgi:sugar lactone lactonase YvrE
VITDTSWVRHNVGAIGEEMHTGGVADFDGDGYLDLVAGAFASESNEIRLWENYGLPVPRIQCQAGYTATLYAQGLSSPDGLAFDPSGVLHVAEETAGRVSRIEPEGGVTTMVSGLASLEGIAFDTAGNLYVVEDVQNGRLVRVAPGGGTTDLATGRDAPEGVVWASDGTTYITESNVEFTSNPSEFRARVTAVSPSGGVTVLRTDNLYWSYAGITMGADGLLYVTNEASGTATTDSIFTVDPATRERTLFTSGLIAPEGLCFAANGDFPLYVVEEDIGSGTGRLSRVEADGSHAPFCTGFYNIEDVAVDESGRLYVSEDGSGWIIAIEERAHQVYLPVMLRAH